MCTKEKRSRRLCDSCTASDPAKSPLRYRKLAEALRVYLEETNTEIDIDFLWAAWNEFEGAKS
jgi:hypothetical protein